MKRTQHLKPGSWGWAPSTYPYAKPFYDTPYDPDRRAFKVTKNRSPPKWLEHGADGSGFGIGIRRTHPLSNLTGNLDRSTANVPKLWPKIMHGVWHSSGRKMITMGGSAPAVHMHPYLNGEPCPVYGWKILEEDIIRKFETPHIEDKTRYKAYVGVQERNILQSAGIDPASLKRQQKQEEAAAKEKKSKSLSKRLFFWR